MSDPKRTGPEPDRLRLDEKDWKDAVKKALKKRKPPEGFPSEGPKTANDANLPSLEDLDE